MRFVGWAIPTFSRDWRLCQGRGVRSTTYGMALCLLAFLCPIAAAASNAWQVPEAVLKFTIEADPNQPPAPNVDLSGKKIGPVDWSGAYYRIDGTTYKNALPMTCPGQAAYACKQEYRRFLTLIGVREDADENAAFVFEVFADKRKLYSSPPLTKYSNPVGVDVRVPARTKEIRLVTSGSSSQGHHWAGWVNAGFQTKNESPRVAHVTLPVPGFDPSKYEVVVFTGNDVRVMGQRLGAPEQGKVDHLFFGGHGWSTYYAYWVPKDRYTPEPREWSPDAGLILETRQVDSSRQQACEDLPGFRTVWNEAGPSVGRNFVEGIHHGYPVHPHLWEADGRTVKDKVALYHFTGFFEAARAGEYVFATASNWGSHVLVDGQPVVSWPGRHDYREGITGQKRGKAVLQPGVHKLDYFNYSPWGTMFTLAAWQPPGGKLGVMTGSDFPAVRGYVVTGVEYNPAAEPGVNFDWSVVDDWRLDHDRIALIRMRFQAVPELGIKDGRPAGDYRWTFDDGVVRTGRTTERVFLAPGKHTVTVQKSQGDRVLAQTVQTVYAGALADKIWVEPRQAQAFRQEITRIDFRKAPIQDVVRLFALGREMSEPSWRDAAVPVLLERQSELVPRPQYQPLCLELGQYLSLAAVQQYDQALGLYTSLLAKVRPVLGSPTPNAAPGSSPFIRQQTMVLAGELLLRALGKPEAALQLLNPARWEKAPDQAWTIRLGVARAEALLALGDTKELDAQMRQLRELKSKQDSRRQDIRHAGLLDQAARWAKEPPDPAQSDYALGNLETVLREEPDQVLAPGVNLVRLDVHIARGEYRIARHLAERLAKMDMTVHDRTQVLVRHIRAACVMGDVDSAKKLLEELVQIYPNSEPAAQAKTLVVEAMTKTRRQ